MQRGSDQHSARLDDELAHEVDPLVHGGPDEGRTDAFRKEDLPIGDGVIDGAHRDDVAPAVPGLDEKDLDLRAALAATLAGARFPATAQALRRAAEENNATPEVLATFDALPAGRAYEAVGEVWADAGGADESDVIHHTGHEH